VVVLSSSVLDEDRRRSLLLRARAFYTKAASTEDYVWIVKEIHSRWIFHPGPAVARQAFVCSTGPKAEP
jgi:hypothetical protein